MLKNLFVIKTCKVKDDHDLDPESTLKFKLLLLLLLLHSTEAITDEIIASHYLDDGL